MPEVSFVCCHSAWVVTDVHVSSYMFQRTVSKYDQCVLLSLMSAVGCLTRDDVIRCSFAHNADCWMALVDVVVSETGAERCCYWMFSCFCVSFTTELTVIPEQLQSLRIQRGPLCFARFYHEFVSSRFTSDPGKITVFYLPSEKSVIQTNIQVCSIEDIKADGEWNVADAKVNTWISPCLFQEHAAALCICCVDLLKDNNGDIVTVGEPSFGTLAVSS